MGDQSAGGGAAGGDRSRLCVYSDGSEGYGYGGPQRCDSGFTSRYFTVLHALPPVQAAGGAGGCGFAVCNASRREECKTFQGGLAFRPSYYAFLQGVGSTGGYRQL
jgi:hypothetical protein